MAQKPERASKRMKLFGAELSLKKKLKKYFSKDNVPLADTDTESIIVDFDETTTDPVVIGLPSADVQAQQLITTVFPEQVSSALQMKDLSIPLGGVGALPTPEVLERAKQKVKTLIRYIDESDVPISKDVTTVNKGEDTLKAFGEDGFIFLGAGDHGVVHLHHDPLSNKHFAIKRIKLDTEELFKVEGADDNLAEKVASLHENLTVLFLAELNTHSSGSPHPTIITLYDYSFEVVKDASGKCSAMYLVLKMQAGESDMKTLYDSFKDDFASDPQLRLWMLTDVLCGLSYIHKNSATHGDLKMANIFVGRRPNGAVSEEILHDVMASLGAESGSRNERGERSRGLGKSPLIFMLGDFGVSTPKMSVNLVKQAYNAAFLKTIDAYGLTSEHDLKRDQQKDVICALNILFEVATGDSEVTCDSIKRAINDTKTAPPQSLSPIELEIVKFIFNPDRAGLLTANDVLNHIRLFVAHHTLEECLGATPAKGMTDELVDERSTAGNQDKTLDKEGSDMSDLDKLLHHWKANDPKTGGLLNGYCLVKVSLNELKMDKGSLGENGTDLDPQTILDSNEVVHATWILIQAFRRYIYYHDNTDLSDASGESKFVTDDMRTWISTVKRPLGFEAIEAFKDLSFSDKCLQGIYKKMRAAGIQALNPRRVQKVSSANIIVKFVGFTELEGTLDSADLHSFRKVSNCSTMVKFAKWVYPL